MTTVADQVPQPPAPPLALPKDVEDAIKLTAKGSSREEAAKYFDEQLEEIYKSRDERMHEQWTRQMDTWSERVTNVEIYNDMTKGKSLVGAIYHQKSQPGANAKTISDGLKSFTGGSQWEKTLNLEDPASGGTLVQGEVLDFFFGPLRANSVVYSLGPRRSPMVNDQGTLTGFETDPSITWVGEVNTTQEIVSEPTTGNRTYSAKKAMMAVPLGNDLLGSTLGAQIANAVEEQIQFGFTIGFDIVLISGVGTLFRPKGLRNWALAANEVASGGTNITNIYADYRDAFNAVESLNVPMRNMGQIMAPRTKNHIWLGALNANDDQSLRREMATGTLFGVPWRVTTNVPTNLGVGTDESYIIFADFSQVVVKEGTGLDISRSGEASWTQNATVHLPREEDVTVMWAKSKIDMVVPHPEAVYIITGVQWGT